MGNGTLKLYRGKKLKNNKRTHTTTEGFDYENIVYIREGAIEEATNY